MGNFQLIDTRFERMAQAANQTPMSTKAIEEMLTQLEPLREIGIICRASANTPGASGHVLSQGQIVIWYAGDTEFTALSGQSTQQSYRSSFILLGRMNGIKSSTGVEAVRDVLYRLLVGVRLSGYREPLRIESFTVGDRASDHHPFQMAVSAPAILNWCVEDGGEIEGVVAGAELGVLLSVLDIESEVLHPEVEIGR